MTVESKVRFTTGRGGRKRLERGQTMPEQPAVGRVPHISRLMALAIRVEQLVREGKVKDYAELARLGHVSRARISQIMNLLNLAPDIQEAILFLPAVERGRDPVKEWQVRPVAAEPDWRAQRRAARRDVAPAS
jgi:hypothetical protein